METRKINAILAGKIDARPQGNMIEIYVWKTLPGNTPYLKTREIYTIIAGEKDPPSKDYSLMSVSFSKISPFFGDDH